MTKADLSKEEWNNITSDLLNWKGGVKNKDLEIFEAKSSRSSNGTLPNIRNSSKGFRNSKPSVSHHQGSNMEKSRRISSVDYKSWENFDADEECKKMDLEEEQKQSAENRKNNSEAAKIELISESIEELALASLGDISHLSSEEREVMAVREKDIGNEFYNTNKVEEAIKHYTRSILLSPTVAGLNNRAAAYLRQCSFNKALDDLNQVLEIDPKNVKARYRRAQSFQHKNMFREALEDINEVLMKEPSHLVARHIADQLRESVSKLPKMHKIKIKDKETGKTIIKPVTEEEMLNDYKDQKFIEVNDWGLPKIMCNCNGKHSNDPGIRHEDHVRYQHLNRPPQKKIVKVETPKLENFAPIALPAKKLEILEVEKGSQEMETLPGKKLEILEVEKGSQETENGHKDVNNSCVVADMRTAKSTAKPGSPTFKISHGENDKKSHQLEADKEVIDTQNTDLPKNQRSSITDTVLAGDHNVPKSEKSHTRCDTSPKIDSVKHKAHDVSLKVECDESSNPQKGKKANGKSRKSRDLSPMIGNDKSLKTNKNSMIKDISSSTQSSRTEFLDTESLIPDRVKGVKTDKNFRIQDNRTVNGHVDNKMESSAGQPCGCLEVFNKFQFKKEWSVLTGPRSLEQKAKLLKSICPKHLVKAFGNSWEKEMLVDVFECLRHHFSPAEQQRVAEYLTVVPQLDRFKINAMFLTTEEKSLARELVKNCSAHLDSSTWSAFS